MPPPKQKWKIFLAEDNPWDAFLVRRALDYHCIDYELNVARNGDEAISIVRKAEEGEVPIDLMLVDLHLPFKDGGQIVAEARSGRRLEKTPIIVMTSSTSPQDRSRIYDLGASLFFHKPYDLNSFMQVGQLVKDMIAQYERVSGSTVS
jgi:chemotaxis family two-component system response regulator Rcp1